MVRLFVRHNVKAYDHWRAKYDDFDGERKGMGVRDDGVFRAVDDPNDVTVFHDFDSREAAESFAGSPRLGEVMAEAGVDGQPEIWFVEAA